MSRALSFITLLIILSSFNINAQNQDGYLFKTEFRPNSIYHIDTDFEINSKMVLLAENPQQKNRDKVPISFKLHFLFNQIGITGEQKNDGSIPVEFEIRDVNKSITINDKKEDNFDLSKVRGLKVKASYNKNLLNDFEISGISLNEGEEHKIVDAFKKILTYIKYPEKPLAIGDTFVQEEPVQLPLTDLISLNVNIIVKYTLTRIESNKAYFDADTKIFLEDSDNDDIKINARGRSILVHDLNKNFLTQSISEMTIDLEAKVKEGKLKGKLKFSERTVVN